MAGLKWNTGKLYYSTVELGNQQIALAHIITHAFLAAPAAG